MSADDSLAPTHGVPCPDEALASVAHELRLPLSHIKGFVGALRRRDVEWDSKTSRDYLEEIELEADRLAEIVDSMMDAARPGQLRRSPAAEMELTPPAIIVDGAIHRVRGLLGNRRVRLDLPPDLPPVHVNVSRMERVLANLLHNAIKYTPDDTPIDVAAYVTRDGELELIVADRGPGIAAAHHHEIFQPFFRSHDGGGSAAPGHGLGLAIAQSTVLAHGGRMSVANRLGGGASFSVFLPLQKPE